MPNMIQVSAFDPGTGWLPNLLPMTEGCAIEEAANENWKQLLRGRARRCRQVVLGGAQCTLPEDHAGALHVCVANKNLYARWVEVP